MTCLSRLSSTPAVVACAVLVLAVPVAVRASGHREAPLVALDRAADVSDVFAFRSYGDGPNPTVTLIMSVDPLLEPFGGPVWFPFDPDLRYEIDVDNDNDAVADVRFVFRFRTESRLPDLYQAQLGVGAGAVAPGNSPPPVAPGAPVVPPQIGDFDDDGLGLVQTFTANMQKGGVVTQLVDADPAPFHVLPANVGPRTADASSLRSAAIYSLPNGIKLFAGTTDDAFAADQGGLFDTYNVAAGGGSSVLSATEDAAQQNFVSDSLSGLAVNSIAIQVPVTLLTRTGNVEPATSTAATIGVWGVTWRRFRLKREPAQSPTALGDWTQVQRMGNPLINLLLVGMDEKNAFSTKPPRRDDRYLPFFFDPGIARVVNALSGGAIAIRTPPRTDLLPLFTYAPPIAAAGTPAGPIADLLRLNTGVPPTAVASASRLGLLGGDPAGFPNGRRVFDDVTDVMLRVVVGGVLAGSAPAINTHLGDGVNVNDAPFATSFPYLAPAPSGRTRRHIDPGEAGCTAGAGAACPP